MGRSKRKPADSSLLGFVKALEGMPVTVELRNDATVTGLLGEVDDGMKTHSRARSPLAKLTAGAAVLAGRSLHVTDAEYQPLQGTAVNLESMFVRATNLRYIHLPASLDPAATLDAARKKAVAAALYHKRQAAFGQHVAAGPRPASGEHSGGRGESREGERRGGGDDGGGAASGGSAGSPSGGAVTTTASAAASFVGDNEEEEPGLYDDL